MSLIHQMGKWGLALQSCDVSILSAISKEQYEAVCEILEKSPGRYKSWSEEFHFLDLDEEFAMKLGNYLQEQGLPFEVVATHRKT